MAIHEQFYSVADVSAILSISKDAVRKMFRHRPGVMRLSSTRRPRLRIPETLLRAVLREMGYTDGDTTNNEDPRRDPARA